MSRYISDTIRKLVFNRADYRCEYCRMPQAYTLFSFQIDHIRSLKHGGKTDLDNLALACGLCNLHKGTDLGTALSKTRHITPFFHPRLDIWNEHFELTGPLILPKTEIGAATIQVFLFNEVERIMERQILVDAGLFPI